MAKQKRGQGEPTVIKKYANRRLYDTGRSSYVTLDDLCEMTRDGYEFVVYDAKTGEDITRSVLAQIMAEKRGWLRTMARASSPSTSCARSSASTATACRASCPNYLESAFDLFVKNQEQMREQISKSFEGINPMKNLSNMGGMFPGASAIEELNRQNAAMIERTMKMFTPFGMPGSTSEKPSSSRSGKQREQQQGR